MISGFDRMRFASAALRGVLIAPPGKKLNVADLSNIEGRVLAWVSGEKWKLEAFREYDAGTGPDLYNITAVNIIGGDPWKVPKKDRNAFGKVPDLASGYMGGVSGYQTFARAYNTRMADHWDTIQKQIDPQFVAKAWGNLEKWGRPQLDELEIEELEWVASETCKLAWRARHPATVRFWYALQDAARAAIKEWGTVFTVGQFIKVRTVTQHGNRWLLVKLPGGRYLTYFNPVLERGRRREDGTYEETITYEGEASEAGKTNRLWRTIYTHGGKMTGNVCQTIARDILTPALLRAEARGYLTVLSVHDEAVTETPDTPDYSSDELAAILSAGEDWTTGLPLAAAGFEAYRYKKED